MLPYQILSHQQHTESERLSVVITLTAGRSEGSNPGMRKRFVTSPQRQDRLRGPTHPPIQWLPRFFPGGKTAGV
jgi:hypothetical protein